MPLEAIPKSLFSWNFSVVDGSRHVSDLGFSWWGQRGQLVVAGEPFDVYREGLLGAFVLESRGSVVARAVKPSAFHRSFEVEHEDRQFTLRAASPFRREFILYEGGRDLGSVAPAGIFTRRASVTFPADIPLPVRVFMIWLAILLWRRQNNAAAGS